MLSGIAVSYFPLPYTEVEHSPEFEQLENTQKIPVFRIREKTKENTEQPPMREIKLTRVIKSLNNKELKRFRLFVDSTYSNKNPKLSSLLEYFCKHHPGFNFPEFSEENAFYHIFKEETYRSDVVVKLASKLFKLLTDFLSAEHAISSEFNLEFNLLRQYSLGGLSSDFDRLSAKMLKKGNPSTSVESEDYYNMYRINREINRVHSTRKDKGVGDVHFKEAARALDIYYLYTKLIYTCQEINRRNVIKGMQEDEFSISMVEIIPDSPYIKEPIIDIWFHAYLLLSKEDKLQYYKVLKNKLFNNHTIPAPSQLRMLFTYLENTSLRIFKDRQELYKEVFELYDFQITRDIFLQDNAFIPAAMKNYMTVSLNLGKTEEAKAFLNKIKTKVNKLHPNSFLYCTAMLQFKQEKYEETLDILNQINFNNIIMKLNERTMRLKVYFHLKYWDLLFDNLNSFRVFLTNNKEIISDRLLDANRRFANHLSKLSKTKTSLSNNYTEIKETISKDGQTVEKTWLLEVTP